MKDYPLVIIGGGAGAFAAATKANDLNQKAVITNAGLPIGGTCVNVGCVPSKHLLEVGAQCYYGQHPKFSSIGINGESEFDFNKAIAQKDEIVGSLRVSNYKDVVSNFKTVEYIEGKARFISKDEIEVDGERIRGDKFVIATGSKAKIPPIGGIDKIKYLTNVEALQLDHLPESMIVLGGGPLGLEFAQMFHHFGTKITVVEMMDRILPLEEPEISKELMLALEEEGISIHIDAEVKAVREESGYKVIRVKAKGREEELKSSEILVATGVTPNTKDLGLEKAGVETNARGYIKVDAEMRTTGQNIWAAGDCVGKLALETVAAKEGAVAAENTLTGSHRKINYDEIPHAVFTSPQVASVGLTEEELMRRMNVCACRTVPLASVPKARAVGEDRGVIKLVIDPYTKAIVGCHIVAPAAAEMIHEAVMAVRHKVTIDDIIDTVHVFPTFSEGIKLAAQAFERDIRTISCCIG